ncbi:MAG: hypothetical protein MI975_10095 [Cytophagales bacterium]|nr:hypothetical protein [Cytophagales bacterium]
MNTFLTDDDGVFKFYPEFANINPFCATIEAATASFHNGLCIHGAGANMIPDFGRVMTCAYMPDGAIFEAIPEFKLLSLPS